MTTEELKGKDKALWNGEVVTIAGEPYVLDGIYVVSVITTGKKGGYYVAGIKELEPIE